MQQELFDSLFLFLPFCLYYVPHAGLNKRLNILNHT